MPTYAQQVAADGASAYWPLNETSGTTAVDQIAGLNGTMAGGVTLGVPGPLITGGTAMRFNGVDGKITCGSLNIPIAFSVEGWIRTSQGTTQQPIFSNRTGTANLVVATSLTAGKFGTYFNTGGPISGTVTVTTGTWRHVVVTHDGTNWKLYVDGALDASGTLSRPAGSANTVAVGYDPGAAGQFWNGDLANIAVYPSVLTPSQIVNHYTVALTSPLLALPWVFLEDADMLKYNVWTPVTPSDAVDFARATDGIFVGTGGTVAAVMQNNTMPVVITVPSGGWLPLVARRINATNTTATGIVALNAV